MTNLLGSGRRSQVILVSSIIFLFWFAMYTYVPSLPVYTQTMTTDLALVGVVLAQYGLWQAIVRLPVGIAADWIGWRKPFIIAGILLAGVGALVMGASSHVYGVLVGRAVTGLAASSWVPLVVAFSSLFPAEEAVRATSLITLINTVSRMLATSSNGPMNDLGGFPLAFYVAAGLAGLALVCAILLAEKRRPANPPSLVSLGTLILRRDVLLPSLLNSVTQYAIWGTTYGFFPILAKQLGANNLVIGGLGTLSLGSVLVGNLTVAGLARRLGNQRLVYGAFILTASGIALAAFANTIGWILAATVLVGYAQGIGYPVLMGMSIERVSEAERTTAMGLHQAVYALGMFGGPWLSGVLTKPLGGLQPMFAVTAVAVLILGLVGTRGLASIRKAGLEPDKGEV